MSWSCCLSGPNLNLLGEREPDIYGTATLDDHVEPRPTAAAAGHGLELEHLQSNHEGELVDAVHAARGRAAALVINAGALTHTAWSLHDALAAFDGPVVELHLSNPAAREPWRHTSVVAPVADGVHRRLRGRRLRAGRRRRRRTAEGSPTHDHHDPLPPRPRPGAPRRSSVAGRLDSPARRPFDEAEVDALLVTTLANIRYLTGFTGSAGVLARHRATSALLATDGRYRTQSAEQLAAAGVGGQVEIAIGGVQAAARRRWPRRRRRRSPASGSRPTT